MAAYTPTTWTAGDTITEAKLDAMVANDQSEDAHAANGYIADNNVAYKAKDAGGTAREIAKVDASSVLKIGSSVINSAFLTKIKAYGWLDGNVTNANDDDIVPLNAELWDLNSNFNIVTSRYVAPITGYYLVVAQIGYGTTNLTAGEAYGLTIRVGGVSAINNKTIISGTANTFQISASGIIQLTAGDGVSIHVETTDTNLTVSGASYSITFMSIHLLSID
jgi:hypothetical protein